MKHYLWRSALLLAVCLGLAASVTRANDIKVSNVILINTNITGVTEVQFDLSWSNSWRRTWGETNTTFGIAVLTNWDAAWVFIKYRIAGGDWQSAYLAANGHTVPAGVTITVASNGGATNIGAFIYRSSDGRGGLNLSNVRLCWNYTANNLDRTNRIDVGVYAIEMVYVPGGSFCVGDGTTSVIQGQFESGTSGTPFAITNEAALTLGGGGAGSLGNNNAAGMGVADDFNDTTSQTLSASYPKGYQAFYCMKYEITQEQYKDFLNSLTLAQQTNLVLTTNASWFALSATAGLSYRNGIRVPATVPAGPIVFGCDYNANGVFNESGDGQDLACNYLGWAAGAAYADWSGLRPMTALEFEKVCRGTRSPVVDEYAWGSTNATQQTNYTGTVGSGTETALPQGANCSFGGAAAISGPVRAGIYATTNSTRVGSGAGYYGVMELGGNVREVMISAGKSQGRSFTGTHGDGSLDTNGWANAASWPSGASSDGWAMLRADWQTPLTNGYGRASSRYYGGGCVYEGYAAGFRAVRTAP